MYKRAWFQRIIPTLSDPIIGSSVAVLDMLLGYRREKNNCVLTIPTVIYHIYSIAQINAVVFIVHEQFTICAACWWVAGNVTQCLLVMQAQRLWSGGGLSYFTGQQRMGCVSYVEAQRWKLFKFNPNSLCNHTCNQLTAARQVWCLGYLPEASGFDSLMTSTWM